MSTIHRNMYVNFAFIHGVWMSNLNHLVISYSLLIAARMRYYSQLYSVENLAEIAPFSK